MSFLTEYFDNYRQHKIVKTQICDPSLKFPKLEGTWYDPKLHATAVSSYKHVQPTPIHPDSVLLPVLYDFRDYLKENIQQMSQEEIKKFIKETTRSLRGQSTYYNELCAHLDQNLKTRKPVPKVRPDPCKPIPKPPEPTMADLPKPMALKETEIMKKARSIYERDMEEPTLEPLQTHFRILGYSRPHYYKTALSEYQESIGRVAYEMIRDDRVKRRVPNNGNKPIWGYPPERPRQPLLEAVPYDGERIY